jgi:hypothetical protein
MALTPGSHLMCLVFTLCMCVCVSILCDRDGCHSLVALPAPAQFCGVKGFSLTTGDSSSAFREQAGIGGGRPSESPS